MKKLGARPGDSVVLAPAQEVNALMQRVPEGKLVTLNEICQYLARMHKADYCCPLTTGIFVMTVANAAEESGSTVPYWRTIKNSGELNDKFPGGVTSHKRLVEQEGFSVVKRGGKFVIANFEAHLHHF